jgi:hypothetical protein
LGQSIDFGEIGEGHLGGLIQVEVKSCWKGRKLDKIFHRLGIGGEENFAVLIFTLGLGDWPFHLLRGCFLGLILTSLVVIGHGRREMISTYDRNTHIDPKQLCIQ